MVIDVDYLDKVGADEVEDSTILAVDAEAPEAEMGGFEKFGVEARMRRILRE